MKLEAAIAVRPSALVSEPPALPAMNANDNACSTAASSTLIAGLACNRSGKMPCSWLR
ncbi:MAG: hypothetical protein HGA90_06945, partial [Alphaproteobacteria bacterium]|nr:hypothetical protein [Alphaproteobacteria bacterium]